MIEIRQLVWMTGSVEKTKLQYRYRSPMPDQSILTYPPEDWVWSDWIDVKREVLDDELI